MLIVACLTSPLFADATDLNLTSMHTTDVHFNYNGNNFGGKLFFNDVKTVAETVVLNWAKKTCTKQIRWYYFNPARGLRVWPLDADTLDYLRTVDSSYNKLSIAGGLFICDDLSIYGSIVHTLNMNTYYLIAWVNYDFLNNSYLPNFMQTMLFVNWLSLWYVFDSYGGIASLFGAGLIMNATCGNGVVEWSEICDQWANNGKVWYCNATCNGMTPTPAPGWGGGWWGGGSISPTPSPVEIPFASGINQTISGLHLDSGNVVVPQQSGTQLIPNSPYGTELTNAYLFAYKLWITTQRPITTANLQWNLTREQAAKMISQFAVKVLNKTPDPMMTCKFTDITKRSQEMQYYIDLSCRLGIMGLQSNGTPNTVFSPNTLVNRAQFGTMLSRLLYGNTYNAPAVGKDYYSQHLKALKTNSIMKDINKPWNFELRWNVMIMVQRVADK